MSPGQNFDEGGPEELTKEVEMKVGGFGLRTTESKAKIWLEKKSFTPGEKMRVHINVDNTKCKKATEKIKTKLIRKCSVFNGKEGGELNPVLVQQEYVDIKKHPMVIAGKTQEHKFIEYELPKVDKDNGVIKTLHPDLRSLTGMLTFSATNPLFKIEYMLEIYLKHQSKLEFGQGNSVIIPIIIRGQGEYIDILANKVSEWETQENVPTWNPTTLSPLVYCDQVKDSEGKYHGVANISLEEVEEDKLDILDPSRVFDDEEAEEEKKEE